LSSLNNLKPTTPNSNPKKQALAIFIGGLLPVIAFTVIEEYYGIIAGLIAGMVFGIGEILYEFIRYRKVSPITWIGCLLLLVLGGVSLISSDGLWFKLQPAFIELGMFFFLIGSWLFKKPFLRLFIEKQNPNAPEFIKDRMSGMTLRLSLFMLGHATLATWAALYWSNEAWALLKGVGLIASTIFYMVIEVIWAKKILNSNTKSNNLTD
jgi:intracellular septation protein